MAVVAIKHAKVVSIPDDPNYPVGSNEWNENHLVTGLENVDNTSDANKPVSTAQAAAIAVVQSDIAAHEANMANPHAVTKAQVGLGNVDNTSDVNKPVSTAQAAADAAVAATAANASNLTSGTVPAARLPALVTSFIGRTGAVVAALGDYTASLITYVASGVGAVVRTLQVKLGDVVSVTDFGAKGDGVNVTATVSITSGAAALTATGAAFTAADVGKTIVVPGAGAAGAELITTIATFTDAAHIGLTANAATTLSAVSKSLFYGTDNTTAFNNALAAAKAVSAPAGNFGISGTVQLITAGNNLIGTGTNSTIITSTSKTAPAIQSGQSVQDWGVKHMTITRAPVATSGAFGIYQPNTNDAGNIDDVNVSRHYVGVSLSSTGYSRFTRSTVGNNISHGVQFIPTVVGGEVVYQWNLDDILSGSNGGDGFRIETLVPGSCTMGNWLHISSFSNVGAALRALGSPTGPISNIRITGMFAGQDGLAATPEIILDTYNNQYHPHSFTDCCLELAAGGFFISANNGAVSITNPWIEGMSGDGIRSEGGKVSVDGGSIVANGIGIDAAGGRLAVSDCTISNNSNVGIAIGAGTGPHLIVNNDFNYGAVNTNGAINGVTNAATGSKILNNIGYNPVGMHSITVGASPFTYTTGPSGENVFISGGTVAAINVNGFGAFGSVTNLAIPLEPYGSVTVAYSVAPTMNGLMR